VGRRLTDPLQRCGRGVSRGLWVPVLALTLIFPLSRAPAQAPEEAPAALYQAAQAQRGKAIYASKCGACHGKALTGGGAPALTGTQFFTREMNNKIGDVFRYMVHEMPAGQPGSLTHEQYADLMSFILQTNGFPAGDSPLSYDAALESGEIIYFAKP
jgi:polar amino acid transport system substrate-binding protein